jgi:hypothetical protein
MSTYLKETSCSYNKEKMEEKESFLVVSFLRNFMTKIMQETI